MVGVANTGMAEVGVGAVGVAGVGVACGACAPSAVCSDCRDSPDVAWGGVDSTSIEESSEVEYLSSIAFRNIYMYMYNN